MGKIVKFAALGAAAVGLFVATGGTSSLAGFIFSSKIGAALALSYTASAFVAGGLIGGAIGLLSKVIQPSGRDMDTQAGSKTPTSGSIESRKIAYGENRIGGSTAFIEEYDSNGSNNVPNDTLVFARIVADHGVEAFGDFYLGDQVIAFDGSGNAATAPYTGKLFLKTYDGSQTTGADPWITAADANWDSTHVGNGTAYYVVKAIFDPEVFPYGANEVLNSSIVVQGKKVYDPRLDSTQTGIGGSGTHRLADPTTWQYSVNPALCIYDMLRDDRIGNPVPDSIIDVSSVAAAANTCDEAVSLKAGGTFSRYELQGIIDGEQSKLANLDLMLTAMSGRRMWLGGTIQIFAGESITATVSIGESDIIDASYIALPPTGSRFNEVRGTFIDASNGYESQEYPARANTSAQTDEGELVTNLHLPFERDHRRAQRLAEIRLNESRQPMMTLQCKPAAAVLAPMDVVAITFEDFGLSSENFRVTKQTVDPGTGLVSLECVKEDTATYSWTAATDELDFNDASALTQPSGRATIDPSGVVVAANTLTALDGVETAVIEVSWDDPGPTVDETIVKYRENGDTIWLKYGSAPYGDNNITLQLPQNTTWDIQVLHVMNNGMESANPDVTTALTTNATNVASVVTNFNGRNDRDGTAVTAPTIASDGTAVDHTIATDGNANISFEFGFSGNEADIDGFVVYVRQSTSATSYNFGTTPAQENVIDKKPNERAFFLYGVPADQYYTFGVRAYRKVDQDIAASGLIQSTLVQCSLAAEDPYRPSATVAFAGDITGTIDGGRVNASDVNIWASVDGRSRIAMAINESAATGNYADTVIRFFGFDATDGNYPDRTEAAVLILPDGSEFTWGGTTGLGESSAYSGNNANGVYYLVVDTSGAKSFVHTGIQNMHVGVCRNIGASTLEYFKANVGWTSLSHDSDMKVIGWCERREEAYVHAELFAPTEIGDEPQNIYSFVGIDLPSHLPIESVGGVYTLEPSDPLSAADVGATATVSIAATTLEYGDSSVSYSSGSVTGLSFSTRYWIYAVDNTFSGGSVTYAAATSRTGLPARAVYFGSILTPADGAGSTSGTQGGYAGVGGTYDPDYNIP